LRKNQTLIASGVILIVILLFIFLRKPSNSETDISITVERGEFVVDVMTSGALEAKNSVNITGPITLRNYRIWEVTIQNMIEEGTFVQKGDFVANLDRSEVEGKVQDAQLDVNQKTSEYLQTELDTALEMRKARDNLVNLDYSVREKKLVLEQSQYEPPANIQKAKIELEKAKRAYDQAKENYEIQEEQNIAKMQIAESKLRKTKIDLDGLKKLSQEFTILAPEDGMLIYKKDWRGQAVKSGSRIGAWDPVVATLPDLSEMLSKTYVNEVDIRKVKVGQPVEIGFDAFPDKKLKGKVMKVANVGEQKPNSDAKVFSVMIEVFGTDPLLKPGMTTSNKIITKKIDDSLFIPLECLHSENDSITYVYKNTGRRIIKQEVMIGEANSENILILAGLEESDQVNLSSQNISKDDPIDLLPEMDGKRQKKDDKETSDQQVRLKPSSPNE